jgi:hypothetical protein
MKIEATCYSKTSIDFNRVDGVISQKIELFIATAVRLSNATQF